MNVALVGSITYYRGQKCFSFGFMLVPRHESRPLDCGTELPPAVPSPPFPIAPGAMWLSKSPSWAPVLLVVGMK